MKNSFIFIKTNLGKIYIEATNKNLVGNYLFNASLTIFKFFSASK